jgi:hypothetical protein
MALLITQGIHDTTQDNKFKPIVANDVLLEITELKLVPSQVNTLEVTFRILDGQYKNRFVSDRITFDATSTFAWKYRQLRECAGVPYDKNEPVTIDIEALLLHKAVKADLSIRKGKNSNQEEQDYQNFRYKVAVVKPVAPVKQEEQKTDVTPTPTPKQETIITPTISTKDNITITDEIEWD